MKARGGASQINALILIKKNEFRGISFHLKLEILLRLQIQKDICLDHLLWSSLHKCLRRKRALFHLH